MAFTTAQLDAIKDAIASGELSIEYEGKKVQYRSMDDLKAAHDMIRAELIATGQITAPATTTVSYVRRVR
jgi:hypothetical protein